MLKPSASQHAQATALVIQIGNNDSSKPLSYAQIAPAAVLSEEELEAKMLAEYNQYIVDEGNFLRQGGFSREEVDEIIAKHRVATGQAAPPPKQDKAHADEDEEQE